MAAIPATMPGLFAPAASGAAPAGMSVTELVATILRLLREQPDRSGFTLSELETLTGSPLRTNAAVLASLQASDRILYDSSREHYRYRALYAADDLQGLLRLLRSHEAGLRVRDLEDAYPGAKADLEALRRTGGLDVLFSATMRHAINGPGAGSSATGTGRASGAVAGRASGSSASAASMVLPPSRQVVLASQAAGLVTLQNDDHEVGDIVRLREPLVRCATALARFAWQAGAMSHRAMACSCRSPCTVDWLHHVAARSNVISWRGRPPRMLCCLKAASFACA